MWLLIRASKTDQAAAGVSLQVSATAAFRDPVHLMHRYMRDVRPRRAAPSQRALFVDRAGAPVTRPQIAQLVKRLAGLAGAPDPERYAAHSIRAGGATAMFEAGVPVETIKAIGRWRSSRVEAYLRHARHAPDLSLHMGFASVSDSRRDSVASGAAFRL